MEIEIVSTYREEDLFAVHERRIGSSRICTVVGLNPYQSPLELWAEMTGKRSRGPELPAMWFGKRLEPVVAEYFRHANQYDGEVTKNVCTAIAREPNWAVATPDYFLTPKGARVPNEILEIKTTSQYSAKRWEDGIPDYAHAQVQWQLGIWSFDSARIACLIGGNNFVVKNVQFSQDVFDYLRELAGKFMEHVYSDTPPPAIAGDLKFLKEFCPPDPDKTISISGELAALAAQFLEVKAARGEPMRILSDLKSKEQAIEAKMRAILGGAQRAVGGEYEIERRICRRTAHTVKESIVDTIKVALVGQGSED